MPPASVEVRFGQIVAALRRQRGVTAPSRKPGAPRTFGSDALKVNGKIFALLSSDDHFVVKLSRTRVDALVAAGAGKRWMPGPGRVMKEWLSVAPTYRAWLPLAKEALDFVRD